ncbi:polyprenyl synthetase family protein [Caulobacter segnis]|uniref:polyprenyl synthetase family protein n=1 Tax=Caulobacter segnis TaxID=88688 RepID=UPI00241082C2|nr:polyprenyl synthetase family protein [Caulobacter segnis]MDG2520613.1 polyprenyl synthetase family protein [Caulobacter segnis]
MDGPARLAQLGRLRRDVNAALDQIAPASLSDNRVANAMRHALLSPGKRIRPLLTLLAAGQLGCPAATAMPAACALEMVHAASLVLDDLPCMDDADERRGEPSVHRAYGEDVAVLAGVGLLNEAYAVIARADTLPQTARVEMIAVLSRCVGVNGLIGGQDRDLLACDSRSFDELSRLHHEKTGVLFVAAVEIGALAAGATPEARETLRLFGCELGLAFQAIDDLIDRQELDGQRAASNLLSVLGADGARLEAQRRMERARQTLRRGPPQLATMDGYLELLVSPAAA